MRRVVFLPGAIGDPRFWAPVARELPGEWEKLRLGWPGLGNQPHDPSVRGLDDLGALLASALTHRGDVVAQSMGAVVALRVAARYPEKLNRLVLVAAPGGMIGLAPGTDLWRAEYRRAFPKAATWIGEPLRDHSEMIATVTAPTLLLWGDADPISPVEVGTRLAQMLPDATLRVLDAGSHGFASEQPRAVAGLIAEHLA
jgi:2-hydroxy-6-oxonona-2,4-dienedioate hydrolase